MVGLPDPGGEGVCRPGSNGVLRRSAAALAFAGVATTLFCMTGAPARIARLQITLDDVEPAVMRRVEVPLGIKLPELHLVIQALMPWENYHLYEFRVGRSGWGLPDPDGDFGEGPADARKVTLAELLDGTAEAAAGMAVGVAATEPLKAVKSLKYLYDFGDGWEHSIKVEAVTEALGVSYPRLLDAQGRCPPEDCGGAPGYEHYLQAIADPKHRRHAEMIVWRGPGFDPNTVDVAGIEAALAKLARKLSPKAMKPRKHVAKPDGDS